MTSSQNTNLKSIVPVKNFVDRALAESQVWINSSTYYQSDLLLRILLDVDLKKSSVEDICSSNDKYPSPDTVMVMLAKSHCYKSRDEIEMLIAELFQNQVKHHQMFKKKKYQE
ncbi:MAG: hypothetical protein OEY49_13725 [Candidatus Heimdallarchaeota archaeon]|nr:hypothetical protein [Candidatus Heimdallarchaeota archaeon]